MTLEIARGVTFANIANLTVIPDNTEIQYVLRSNDVVDTLTRLHTDSAAHQVPPEADLAQLGALLLYRVAAQIVGLDGVESDETAKAFTRIVDGIGKGIALEWLHDPTPIVVEAEKAKREMRELFYEPSLARRKEMVAAYRERRIEKSDLSQDVITLWLLDTEGEVDEELLLIEVGVFLNASTRTTVRILPHIVRRIATWFGGHSEDLPDTEDRAIYGDDTPEFDPYRINRLEREQSPWDLAFGGGAHTCIGSRLATGGDCRRDSKADDKDIDDSLVAVVRAMFETGVRPDPNKAAVDHASAHFSQYDEYLTYPVTFTSLDHFVATARATAKEAGE